MIAKSLGRPIRRIVVVVTQQIGDVLLATPLIREARRLWPEATIDVIGFRGTLGMLRGNADVGELIEAPPGSSGVSAWRLARSGHWRRWDLALVTQRNDRAHYYGFVAAPLRSGIIGADRSATWWKRLLAVQSIVFAGDDGLLHAAVEKVRLLDPWQRPDAHRRRELPPDAGTALEPPPGLPRHGVVAPPSAPLPGDVEAVLEAAPVVVHVPSVLAFKQWPAAHFRELVEALLADGHQVVLTGGPSAADRRLVDEVASLAGPPRLVDVCGRLDFAQVAGLLRRAALFVGPDCSVSHLAAACAVPMVALFGPTNPARWGPLDATVPLDEPYALHSPQPQRRGRVVVIQGPGACVPCARAGCEDFDQSRSACLVGLLPGRVVEEARGVLARAQAPVGAGPETRV